jgi:hypothetical protein
VAVLEDPELAGRLSANARKLAECFSSEHVRLQWEKLFTEVMTQPGTGHEDAN